MNNIKIKGDWIEVKDRKPEYFLNVIIAYSDKDGNNKGISIASLQWGGEWSADSTSLIGEDFDDVESVVRYWTPFQEWLQFPSENKHKERQNYENNRF